MFSETLACLIALAVFVCIGSFAALWFGLLFLLLSAALALMAAYKNIRSLFGFLETLASWQAEAG